jgi:putative peptidoglycan lipid II flippase
MLFIAVPATVGLLVLHQEIVFTLFRYGHFTPEDGARTSAALFFFSIGLSFISVVKVISPAFYAFKDTRTPVLGAFYALLANLIFNLLLFKPLGVGGIALATSLAAVVNMLFLFWQLEKRYFKIPHKEIWRATLKITLASLIMGIACWGTVRFAGFQPDGSILRRAFPLFLALGVGIAVYLGTASLLKIHEMNELWKYLKKKTNREKPSALAD